MSQELDELRKRVLSAPMEPGVYRWLNAKGDIIYVGKAKNLKNRMLSYVQSGLSAEASAKAEESLFVLDHPLEAADPQLSILDSRFPSYVPGLTRTESLPPCRFT